MTVCAAISAPRSIATVPRAAHRNQQADQEQEVIAGVEHRAKRPRDELPNGLDRTRIEDDPRRRAGDADQRLVAG